MKPLAGLLLLLFVHLMACVVQAGEGISGRDLVQQVQDKLRSDSSITTYQMHIETADWQRQVRMQAWDDQVHQRFFIRILTPKKDRDTTWLKNKNNLWMYLPKLERDIRIPPSMMLSSWMGSDFTNDDLVKMQSVVQDYTHKLIAETADVFTVESIPHPDAAVVWGKVVRQIVMPKGSGDAIPLSEDFYDEHGKHIRHLVFDQVKVMGGRRIPSRWTMQTQATPDKRTVMILEQVAFDAVIEDRVFSRAHLRQKSRQSSRRMAR